MIDYLKVKNYKFESLIILFAVLFSGAGFTYDLWNHWPIYALPILYYSFSKRGNAMGLKDTITLLWLIVLLIIQMVRFGGSLTTVIHITLIVVDCYLAARIVGDVFPVLFVKIIICFALISLPFWLFETLGGYSTLLSIAQKLPQLGLENMHAIGRQDDCYTLYVYQIWESQGGSHLVRNPGPFWEPGRFTIYLNIALSISLFYLRKSWKSITVIILLITNITTFSTTGYISMLILISIYLYGSNIQRWKKVVLSLLFIAVIPTILNLDFMSDKISDQMADDASYSRFGAIAYHLTQITESPIIGFGPFLAARYGRENLLVSPNGITDALRYFGIPTAIYLFFLIYKGSYAYIDSSRKIVHIGIMLLILCLAFTQTIMYSPFYYLLYFFAFVPQKNNTDV